MIIVLAAREYPPETADGGIGTQTYAKAHGLSALGHTVVVVSASVDNVRHDYQDREVRVIRIPTFEDRMPLYTEVAEWTTYSALVAAEIARLHDESPVDLVEFPEWGCEAYVHLLNRSEWNHIPTVIQLHGPLVMFGHAIGWPETTSKFFTIGTMMERICLQMADALYSSSANSARWCTEHYELDSREIPVIHTGVDTVHFRPPANSAKNVRPTIIFVGRVTGDKGAPILVEAACRLAQEIPDLQLRLLGKGNPALISELTNKAIMAGQPDLLDFAGFVDHSNLPGELGRAHVFALPSQYEPGPGMVYLEAMACGLPVIACEGAGAAEVVRHGENGILIPPDDIDALVDGLRTLLLNQSLREQWGSAAREYAVETAETKTCIKRIEVLYENVVNDCRTQNDYQSLTHI
jgi:glycosyltransferase involved in cell wall biosynthesis